MIAFEAKRPVAIAPHVPPMPWTPTTSRLSSYPNFDFRLQAAKQSTPPPMPIRIAETGPTKPAAGVMATSPATAPDAAPRTVGFPRSAHSANIHASVAAAAAVFVVTKAVTARPPAPSALPALKPNQPTQSIAAPMTVNGRLWGGIGSRP